MYDDFVYILGPCSLDNRDLLFEVVDELYFLMEDKNWYLKTSFDKANRTSLYGKRGVGLEKGIEIFQEIKKKYSNIKLTTDVHEAWEVEKLIGTIDLPQIPAFLSRQTDLIVECAKNFNIVNIKKMQHLGPNNVIKSVDKVKDINPNAEVWLTERGTAFGYDHLIVDFTIVDEIKKYYDKFLFDCSHSPQRSRAIYKVQGDPKLAEKYFKIAEIMGYDGVFVETHPRPQESSSDGDCMINLRRMKELLKEKFEQEEEEPETDMERLKRLEEIGNRLFAR